MKINCPYCGEKFELEAYLKDKTIMRAILLLPEFVPHHRIAWEYAEKFRIGPPLNAHKLVRVLEEVLDLMKSGAFDFQKKRYEISREGVAEGMRTVCNAQIKGALTNHNYLKKILIDISDRERERRGKEDEQGRRKREEGSKNEIRPGVEGDPGAERHSARVGTLIAGFVRGLEGAEGLPKKAKEYDPTDKNAEVDRALDRARGVMRPEREP